MNDSQIMKMYTRVVHTKKMESGLSGIHSYCTFWQKHGIHFFLLFVFCMRSTVGNGNRQRSYICVQAVDY